MEGEGCSCDGMVGKDDDLPGVTFLSSRAANHRAPVPRIVILKVDQNTDRMHAPPIGLTNPNSSTQSQRTLAEGMNGEPS